MQEIDRGTLVNERYEVLSLIGAGGMGAVYRARDLRFKERVVALKQLIEDPASGLPAEVLRNLCEKEANVLERVKHPAVPRVLDYFSDGPSYYMIMEFIEGTSLDAMLAESLRASGSPMPQDQVVRYAIQICNILAFMHGQPEKVVHRDIKPQNIIVRKGTDQVVLVDFGLARVVQSEGTKTLAGTLGYAPLEQVRGHPEPRSDIYALGATMHHLIGGKTPNPFQIPPIAKVFPNVHPELAAVIDRATQEQISRRYDSASRMGVALQKVLSLLDGTAPAGVPPPPAEEPPPPEPAGPQASPAPMTTGSFVGLVVLGAMLVSAILFGIARFQDVHGPSPTPRAVVESPVAKDSTIAVAASPSPHPTPSQPPSPRPHPRATKTAPAMAATPTPASPTPPAPEVQSSSPAATGSPSITIHGNLAPPGDEERKSAMAMLADGSRKDWDCVGVQGLAPGGTLQTRPQAFAAVQYVRRGPAAGPPRSFSFRVRRHGDMPAFQVRLGGHGVQSSDDLSSNVNQNLLFEVATERRSPALGLPLVDGASPEYTVEVQPDRLDLSVEGGSGKTTLDSVHLDDAGNLIVIAYPADRLQTLEVRDLDVRF